MTGCDQTEFDFNLFFIKPVVQMTLKNDTQWKKVQQHENALL